MSKHELLTGGCMCGAVRYQVTGPLIGIHHCHCRSCRKHNGAVVATLVGLKLDHIEFTLGKRKIYQASPGVGRGFCGDCGTPLTWEGVSKRHGKMLEIHICTFDDPVSLVPSGHLFEPERIPWFDIADDLPRFRAFDDGSPAVHFGPKIRSVS